MTIHGLLPIGSVVLLKDSKKRVMIVGVCQRGAKNTDKIWDYTAVLFPEGYIDAEKMFLFDNEQIDKLYAIGHQDAEQLAFKEKADQAILRLKGQQGQSSAD